MSWAEQNDRWASCTSARGTIRISTRLARVPAWVLDAVIVHELAHLIEPKPQPRFLGAGQPLPPPRTGLRLPRSHERWPLRPLPTLFDLQIKINCLATWCTLGLV